MMKIITAIVADDEPLLRFHLQKTLAEVWQELDIIGSCGNGQEALELIQKNEPDIAFLDIKMPELDGMALASKLQKMENPPEIVFITAYDEFAIKAFEHNAIDYVLKPISEVRLLKTTEKLKQRVEEKKHYYQTNEPSFSDTSVLSGLLAQIQQLSHQEKTTHLSWIKAYKGDDLHLISVADILYLKAEDKYVSVFALTNSDATPVEYLIRSSLKEIHSKLAPDDFWQIHRSSIVNIAKIDKVKKDFIGHMYVHIGRSRLPVSRNAQHLFKGM